MQLSDSCDLITIKKKKDHLQFYEFDNDANFTSKTVDFSSIKFIGREDTPVSLYKLLVNELFFIDIKKIDTKIPTSIGITSSPYKMYHRGDKLMFTFDINPTKTQLVTIDLNSFSIIEKTFDKPKAKYSKGNSYLYKNYLYTVGSNSAILGLRIYNILTGEKTKELAIFKNEPIKFKNSPIIHENWELHSHKEFESTKKFLRKISSADIGLTMHIVDNRYIFTIGSNTSAQHGVGMIVPMVGIASTSIGSGLSMNIGAFYNPMSSAYNSYSKGKTTYIHCMFDENYQHLKGNVPENAFDKIKTLTDNISFIKLESMFKHQNNIIHGHYITAKKKYIFHFFDN